MTKKLVAELIGTFAIVFAGTGAIVANELSKGSVGHVGIALVFGLVVAVFIYSLAPVSGAHFNPAVSFGFFILRQLNGKELICYWIAQFLGGLLASSLVCQVASADSWLGSTVISVSVPSAFVLEVIMTCFLMFVILQTTSLGTNLPVYAGAAIGGAVTVDALFGGTLTGASMNPARSVAPALVSGKLSNLWLFILAPLVGSVVAVLLSSYLINLRQPAPVKS